MVEGIKEATRDFASKGKQNDDLGSKPSVTSQGYDTTSVYGTGCGKRKRSTAKGVTKTTPRAPQWKT